MSSLCAARGRGKQPSLAKFAMKEFHGNAKRLLREDWVVARPFVAQKGVGGVKFEPLIVRPSFLEDLMNLDPSFERDMGVLSSPNHQQFAADRPVPGTLEGIVRHAKAQPSGVGFELVDIRGIKTDTGQDFRIKTRPEIQVSPDANAERA